MARKVTSLTFDLFGRDRTASKTMRGVGDTAGKTAQTLQRAGAAMAAGLAVAGAAAVAFGVQSVRAFAEAQEAQNRLAFAFEKFPALTDTSLAALQRFNAGLMKKTRFDDDAIASGQAVLAQFGLTGDQLRRLTPLLLDYAGATGKDLTTSAEDLGRALLGQGRALKILGIDFSDAGSVAANFDQLMGQLSEKVGGFAERDAETAAGKLDILTNRFGEVQEAVGEALLPALDKLLEWIEGDGLRALEGFAAWFAEDGVDALTGFIDKIGEMAEDGSLVPSIVAGIGAITAAQIGLNAAMAANPVGLVIAGIAALISLGVAVAANFNDITKGVYAVAGGVYTGIAQIVVGVAKGVEGVVNSVLGGLQVLIGPINALAGLLGLSGISLPSRVNFTRGLDGLVNSVRTAVLAGQAGGIDYLNNGFVGGPNTGGAGFVTPGGAVAFAEGGIVRPTPGGTRAVIGEAGEPEAVIPLSRSSLERFGLGGGPTYNVTISGVVAGSRSELARVVVRAIQDAQKLGDVPRGAIA